MSPGSWVTSNTTNTQVNKQLYVYVNKIQLHKKSIKLKLFNCGDNANMILGIGRVFPVEVGILNLCSAFEHLQADIPFKFLLSKSCHIYVVWSSAGTTQWRWSSISPLERSTDTTQIMEQELSQCDRANRMHLNFHTKPHLLISRRSAHAWCAYIFLVVAITLTWCVVIQ